MCFRMFLTKQYLFIMLLITQDTGKRTQLSCLGVPASLIVLFLKKFIHSFIHSFIHTRAGAIRSFVMVVVVV